jgi:hypothetical protein
MVDGGEGGGGGGVGGTKGSSDKYNSSRDLALWLREENTWALCLKHYFSGSITTSNTCKTTIQTLYRGCLA